MNHDKPIATSHRPTARLTPRTFVRAAGFSSLLIFGVCAIAFLIMTVVLRDSSAPFMIVVLFPIMTVAIWLIAAVLGTVLLFARCLWVNRKDPVLRAHRAPGKGPGVWDEWLDGPSRA